MVDAHGNQEAAPRGAWTTGSLPVLFSGLKVP
jgi:hypothetical protein